MNEEKQTIPTRQTLLSRLKDWDDHDSWKEFFDVYWKLIYNAAVKTGLSDSEAQEVVQETVIAISKSMPHFHYDPKIGSFKGWLMRQTSWRIADQFRKRQRDFGGDHDRFNQQEREHDVEHDDSAEDFSAGIIESIPDTSAAASLEAIWDEEWKENMIEAALQRVKAGVDSKHYQIFDLYVIKKWPAAKIAKSLQINRATIYMVKHRISGLFAKELKALEDNGV
jgi:RNA polymerase sigma-70 factor (ECF subfamily)